MTSYVNFTILKSSCNYVYDKITSEEVRDQILEPFTVLVKLAILSFKAEKSKISINKNKIHIQSPNKWQGAVRYLAAMVPVKSIKSLSKIFFVVIIYRQC